MENTYALPFDKSTYCYLYAFGNIFRHATLRINSSLPDRGSGIKACATDAYLLQARLNPQYRQKEEKMNRQIAGARTADTGETLFLPVVVPHPGGRCCNDT